MVALSRQRAGVCLAQSEPILGRHVDQNGTLLGSGKAGPEHQALGRLIGTLVDGRDQNDDKS
jgi:hypothetical protein